MDNALSVQYAAQVQQLVDKSRTMIKELDGNNDLSFIRLRTKKHEVLVAPGNCQQNNPQVIIIITISGGANSRFFI